MRTDPLMALTRSVLARLGLAGGVRLGIAAFAAACLHCGGGSSNPANTTTNQTPNMTDAQASSGQGTNPPSEGTGNSGSNSQGNMGSGVEPVEAGAPPTDTTPMVDAALPPSDASASDAGTNPEGGTLPAAADAGTYSPCPTDGGPCKILPFGDSITYGIEYPGAYRVELFHDALSDHKNITFVGETSLADGPTMVDGVAFPQDNEGHSGWTIDQVASLVPSPALSANPDIILLHIGTNDMYSMTQPVSQAPQRLGSLIDKIVAADPHAFLVVAQITPLANSTWEMQVETYNAALPAIVQPRIAAGKHVALVDMHTGFVTATMLSSDGVHPNETGYNHMGDVWYAEIKGMLH